MRTINHIAYHIPVVVALGMLVLFVLKDHLGISFLVGYISSMAGGIFLISVYLCCTRVDAFRLSVGGSRAQNIQMRILGAFFGGICLAAVTGYDTLDSTLPSYEISNIEQIEGVLTKPTQIYSEFTIMDLSLRTIHLKETTLSARGIMKCFYNKKVDLNTATTLTARVALSTHVQKEDDVRCTIIEVISVDRDRSLRNRAYGVRAYMIAAVTRSFARFPASVSPFLHALFLGKKIDLHPAITKKFRKAGVSHLLALSGMHLAILTFLSTRILRMMFSVRTSQIGNIIFVVFYVWVVGNKPSLNRAAIMLIIWSIMQMYDRNTSNLNGLAYAFILLSLYEPGIRADLSFQLSFAALAGIMIGSKPIGERIQLFLPRCISQPLALTISAQVATLPLLMYHFGVLHPVGIISSLVLTPFITLFMWSALFLIPMYYIPLAALHEIIDKYMVVIYASIQHGVHIFSQFPAYQW